MRSAPMTQKGRGLKRKYKPVATTPPDAAMESGNNTVLRLIRTPKPRLFDNSILETPQATVDFITNILESSTEYSVIAKDLDGQILLWNEGARRLYGYEPDEVIGKANSSILHTPEDVRDGVPQRIMQAARDQHKWEGSLVRRRKR